MEPTPRKFKIKIRVTADYYKDEILPNDALTFDQVVNDWYQNEGKVSLLNYLNWIDKEHKLPREIPYYSALRSFRSGDSVDKEAYD